MSLTDENDTSTNEDNQETELEDIEVTLDEISGETKEADESNKNEEADTEQLETEEKSEEDAEQDESVEESTEEASQDEESTEEVTPSKEEQKRLNDLYAQKRIAEKQVKEQRRDEIQQEHLQSAEDDRDLAVKQLQVDAYNNRVQFNENKLETGLDRAVANIDLFTKGSPEVKQELLRAVDDFEKLYVKYNDLGDTIEVKGDVYQYLNERADSIRRLTDVGARQSKKDKDKATTRTISTPSKTPKAGKSDPDLDAFAEEAKAW